MREIKITLTRQQWQDHYYNNHQATDEELDQIDRNIDRLDKAQQIRDMINKLKGK